MATALLLQIKSSANDLQPCCRPEPSQRAGSASRRQISETMLALASAEQRPSLYPNLGSAADRIRLAIRHCFSGSRRTSRLTL